jgi:LmbE family N-acetylglucosaminyl deacetylase
VARGSGPVSVVFVVCHPDDESLWAGGILHGLAGFDFVRTYVVCLSGNDPASPRSAEFEAASELAGATAGVVLGGPLRPAKQPLPDIAVTTQKGLDDLGLPPSEVDLLVTHSPYGDEHLNPHHVQAYEELLRWTRAQRIPFGWFSVLQHPLLFHRPLVRGLRRHGTGFHLLSLARCLPTPRLVLQLRHAGLRERLRPPRYHLQFAGDPSVKRAMLECYQSIDLATHEAGYAAFTTAVESLYLMDAAGLAAFKRIARAMEPPGPDDLFAALDPGGSRCPVC